jgi:biotin transport system substrate-specific component
MKASAIFIRFALETDVCPVILGSLYIALLAQVEIPLSPIPVTLHTFAIFTLALFQGSRRAFLSTCLFLMEATIGLPVFPGGVSNPLWILAPKAGYDLSFPLAAFLIGKINESGASIVRQMLGLLTGQLLIYAMGISWLSFYVGWKQAFLLGVMPFILFDLVKLLAALSARKAWVSLG